MNDPDLSLSWKKEIKDTRKHLTSYLSTAVSLPIVYAGETPITRKELRDVFLYGDIAHLEEQHRERLKRWKENNIIFEFYTHGSLKSGRKNEKLVNSGNERSPEH